VGCTNTAASTRRARAPRTRKSPAEITMIERAQAACDGGLLRVQAEVRPGMTALEAGEVYIAGVVAAGGEPAAIQESVFSGPPEPLAHMLNSREPLTRGGDYLHVDGAAGYERYHARGTRVFSFGEPAPQLRRLTEIAGGALEVVREVGRAGIPFATLQSALREYHRDTGLPSEQLFAGGYELGVSLPPDWVGELLWSTSAPDMEELIPEGLVTNFESCAHVAVVDTIVFGSAGARTLSSVPTDVLTIAI
jgi:Xaa-Pro aminopeptidase